MCIKYYYTYNTDSLSIIDRVSQIFLSVKYILHVCMIPHLETIPEVRVDNLFVDLLRVLAPHQES